MSKQVNVGKLKKLGDKDKVRNQFLFEIGLLSCTIVCRKLLFIYSIRRYTTRMDEWGMWENWTKSWVKHLQMVIVCWNDMLSWVHCRNGYGMKLVDRHIDWQTHRWQKNTQQRADFKLQMVQHHIMRVWIAGLSYAWEIEISITITITINLRLRLQNLLNEKVWWEYWKGNLFLMFVLLESGAILTFIYSNGTICKQMNIILAVQYCPRHEYLHGGSNDIFSNIWCLIWYCDNYHHMPWSGRKPRVSITRTHHQSSWY